MVVAGTDSGIYQGGGGGGRGGVGLSISVSAVRGSGSVLRQKILNIWIVK